MNRLLFPFIFKSIHTYYYYLFSNFQISLDFTILKGCNWCTKSKSIHFRLRITPNFSTLHEKEIHHKTVSRLHFLIQYLQNLVYLHIIEKKRHRLYIKQTIDFFQKCWRQLNLNHVSLIGREHTLGALNEWACGSHHRELRALIHIMYIMNASNN